MRFVFLSFCFSFVCLVVDLFVSRFSFVCLQIENLVMGVKQCGEGHWKEIMAKYKFIDRTNIDLKDKWRNLTRRFRAEELFARVS